MENPLLHRLMKDDKSDIMHTSAYARAQSGGSMGADSVESFAARRAVDAKREAIRRYNESKIVGEAGVRAVGARQYKRIDDNVEAGGGRDFSGASASDKGARSVGRTAGVKGTDRAMGARRFVEPSPNRSATGLPVRRNPGISR